MQTLTLQILGGGGTGKLVVTNADGKIDNTFLNTTVDTNISGNSATTTKLQTPRTINGVEFDGSSNITIEDNTKLSLNGGVVTGNVTIAPSSRISCGRVNGDTVLHELRLNPDYPDAPIFLGSSGYIIQNGMYYNGKCNIAESLIPNPVLSHVISYGTGPDYAHAALEVRERELVTTANTSAEYSPRIGFHWGCLTAGNLILTSNGDFSFTDQDSDDAYRKVLGSEFFSMNRGCYYAPYPSTGYCGHWTYLNSGVLPSGGIWAYFMVSLNNGTLTGMAGITSGGTTVMTGNVCGFGYRVE